jgi:hypothetical protein
MPLKHEKAGHAKVPPPSVVSTYPAHWASHAHSSVFARVNRLERPASRRLGTGR